MTPLSGGDLGANDAVPSSLNLGLSRFGEGNTNVFLLDSAARRLYRPLTRRGPGLQSCLCTPVWLVQRELRIGHTTLLQTPTLGCRTTFSPLTSTSPPCRSLLGADEPGRDGAGGGDPTDLTRPVTGCGRRQHSRVHLPARPPAVHHHYRHRLRQQHLHLDRWSIQSTDSGLGLEAADRPPFADDRPPPTAYNPISASGPQALINGRGQPPIRARLATTKLAGRGALDCCARSAALGDGHAPSRSAGECRHPPARHFGGLVDGGHRAARTGNLVRRRPHRRSRFHLPIGRRLPVRPNYWAVAPGESHPGWDSAAWPTPLPRPDQLTDFRATVDEMVRCSDDHAVNSPTSGRPERSTPSPSSGDRETCPPRRPWSIR